MKPSRLLLTGTITAGVAIGARRAVLRRPSMPTDKSLYTPEVPARLGELRSTFLGVSSIVFNDGENSILIDGFFTRPSMARALATRIEPDVELIDSSLIRAGANSVSAVFVAHSHYDHALDSAVVASRTGAQLVGSDSTLQIGRGADLSESQMTRVVTGEPYRFGPFSVTLFESAHSPHAKFEGVITSALRPPARIADYKMGSCYSMMIDYRPGNSDAARSILVHASTGYVPSMLAGQRADVAYLGVATLGKQSRVFKDNYWHETVETIGARRVIPIHWDDFTKPLGKPLVPMPYFADDFGAVVDYLIERRDSDGVDFQIPVPWISTDPWTDI